jgi:copper chaperone CopZ
MDEQKLNEILTSYRDAINALIERMDAQDEMVKAVVEKVDGLDHLIFDEVINPAREAMDQSIYETGLNDFGNRYKDKLASYNEKLRPIEGEDFDIVKQAYDGYNSIEGEKPDEAMYVDELIKVVDKQLEDIRSAIGAPANAEVTVSNEDGETKVKVDGKEVSKGSDDEAKEASEVSDDDEEETDPEELAALEKELLAYK